MRSETFPIPVVDIFAGAGGLGEGFSAFADNIGPCFQVALSIEKDVAAVDTLTLRAFFRAFPRNGVPEDYYRFLRGEIRCGELFDLYPEQAAIAGEQTWSATLGDGKVTEEELDARIEKATGGRDSWVLVGGPPCQAYSVIGRSKNKGTEGYSAAEDHRHFLYREYLRIISRHWPAVFVMENVKGILSSTIADTRIFTRMLEDLSDPASGYAHCQKRRGDRYRYRLYPLSPDGDRCSGDLFGEMALRPQDYIVESENYGVPQKRHRVIILGVRDDIRGDPRPLEKIDLPIPAAVVLADLPRLRSGLSRGQDSDDLWRDWLKAALGSLWFTELLAKGLADVNERIGETLAQLRIPEYGRGAEFVPCPIMDTSLSRRPELRNWLIDRRIGGFLNSSTREHMPEDLHRYLFAACYSEVIGLTPKLGDFPETLRPEHKNVPKSLGHDNFPDRFRVQQRGEPATTVMSHIAKDGHYFIHWDAAQCRSLTVREAARLQTFPDSFLFCGNRTEQYTQVGNAVPPFLARQIAAIVADLIEKR